jgi:hypothetical protein
MTSKVEFSNDPVAGMTPSDGITDSTGAGNPAAIVPARWKPFATEPE